MKLLQTKLSNADNKEIFNRYNGTSVYKNVFRQYYHYYYLQIKEFHIIH